MRVGSSATRVLNPAQTTRNVIILIIRIRTNILNFLQPPQGPRFEVLMARHQSRELHVAPYRFLALILVIWVVASDDSVDDDGEPPTPAPSVTQASDDDDSSSGSSSSWFRWSVPDYFYSAAAVSRYLFIVDSFSQSMIRSFFSSSHHTWARGFCFSAAAMADSAACIGDTNGGEIWIASCGES